MFSFSISCSPSGEYCNSCPHLPTARVKYAWFTIPYMLCIPEATQPWQYDTSTSDRPITNICQTNREHLHWSTPHSMVAWNSGICCRIILTWQSKHNDGNWFQRPGGEKHDFNDEQLQTHKCSFNLWGPNFSWEGNWFLFQFERLFLNNLCVCAGEGRLVGLSQ